MSFLHINYFIAYFIAYVKEKCIEKKCKKNLQNIGVNFKHSFLISIN